MDRARNIVGIYPTNTEDIEGTVSNTKETILMNTAINSFQKPNSPLRNKNRYSPYY